MVIFETTLFNSKRLNTYTYTHTHLHMVSWSETIFFNLGVFLKQIEKTCPWADTYTVMYSRHWEWYDVHSKGLEMLNNLALSSGGRVESSDKGKKWGCQKFPV